jgi:two-component system OmpR family response regulator
MRLLLVEDDADLAVILKRNLAQAGYVTDVCGNGRDAEHLGDTEPYDLVVLDMGLPGRAGVEVLKDWRGRGNRVPVIVLTARDGWTDKVDGLKAGADDYVTKPFRFEELEARIRAVLRRSEGRAEPQLAGGEITLDEDHQNACLPDGTRVELTGTEFRLLRYFLLHAGKVLSRSRLYEHVYEYDEERDSNVIEAYVRRLRTKLGAGIIETRRGQGYVYTGRRG